MSVRETAAISLASSGRVTFSTTFERVRLVRETPDQYEKLQRGREGGRESKHLGQPVPDSNLWAVENKGRPPTAHTQVPAYDM